MRRQGASIDHLVRESDSFDGCSMAASRTPVPNLNHTSDLPLWTSGSMALSSGDLKAGDQPISIRCGPRRVFYLRSEKNQHITHRQFQLHQLGSKHDFLVNRNVKNNEKVTTTGRGFTDRVAQ